MNFSYESILEIFNKLGVPGVMQFLIEFFEAHRKDKDIESQVTLISTIVFSIILNNKMCKIEDLIQELKVRLSGAP